MTVDIEQLPQGTVTILFTDAERSTELSHRIGDKAARALLRAGEAIAREQIARHGGIEVKATGDGLMVASQSARAAVICAQGTQVAIEQWNQQSSDSEIHLRAGLHTGEVIRENADLLGVTVNAAKRIESLAPTDGILVSEAVRVVLGASLIDLQCAGEHNLKGFDEPWLLYEVPWKAPAGPGAAFRVILFTITAHSSALVAELGDRKAYSLFAAQLRSQRDAITKNNGGVLKSLGDGLMAVFKNPSEALHSTPTRQSSDRPRKNANRGRKEQTVWTPRPASAFAL